MAKAIANYQRVQGQTASPGQRVVMVYEGITKNIRTAIQAFDESDSPERFEKIHNCLSLAEKLVLELKIALDMERGGEIAKSLDGLYEFWITQLSEANVRKNPEPLRTIFPMIKDLTDSWREAARKVK
jgi:flagellar protein FliS